eukprot:12934016-Prorocentrum_lima.AAC.1
MAVIAPLLSTPACGAGPALSALVPSASLAGVRLRRPRVPSSGGPQSRAREACPPKMAVASSPALPFPAAPAPSSIG